MARAFHLLPITMAIVLAPLAARAGDTCLLCGASGVPAGAAQSAAGNGSRPPIEIELTSGFNFRRFALPGPHGEVLVKADRSSLGDSGGMGGYGLVGQVVVRGAPNSAVAVTLPVTILLTGKGGGRIEIARIATTLPRNPRLDANGRLEFSFSGPLNLPAGAVPGDYQASFSIDATYE